MDSCFEFFFTNLPFCLKLGIEGVTGCGKRANFMGWQATPAFLWRFPRVASGNFRSSYVASIFLEYSVLVICACISVAGAKKEKTPACMGHDRGFRRNRGNSRGPTTIHRSINHSRLYLPSYLIARFAFFYLSSPFMDRPFRDFFVSRIPRLRLFFLLFLPSFSRVLRIAIAGFFSEKGELFLRWIHRSGIRERVPWQRENSNDRTAWERF